MYFGYGAFPELFEFRDGLVYVSDAARQPLNVLLQASTLPVPGALPTTFQSQPGVGKGGGLDTIADLVSNGYVALVQRDIGILEPPAVTFTKSPSVVSDLAKPAGTHAVWAGPKYILIAASAATAIEALPGPTWIVPVTLGIGAVALILFMSSSGKRRLATANRRR